MKDISNRGEEEERRKKVKMNARERERVCEMGIEGNFAEAKDTVENCVCSM